MSRTSAPTLHIEWAPGRVRAIDIESGRAAEGSSLAEVATVTQGHRQALVGVERGRVFLRALRLPKADPEDLRRIVVLQMAQSFPIPPDQLAFDFVQTDDLNADGLLTVVGAVRAEDLHQLRAELREVGITPARVLPVALGTPAVAAQAGAGDSDKGTATAALVVEETSAGLALDVVQGQAVRFSRLAPAGSDVLAEARRTLAAAGTSELPLVAVGTAGRALHGALHASDGALALLDRAPATFAFALDEERAQAAKKRMATRTRFAALMVLAALLLVTLIWADRSDAMAARKRGEGAWARQLGRLRSIRNAETKRAQQAGTIQTTFVRAFEPAQPLSNIAAVTSDALPTSVWLTGLSIERGKPLQIRGTAKTADGVSKFVDSLGASPRFRDVKLVFANGARIEDKPVVQFSITAVAVGNLPMPVATKTTKKARPSASGAGSTTARETTQ